MADALEEAEKVEAPSSESMAGVASDNMRYISTPKDRERKIWARATALVQATPIQLYALWRDVEMVPKWQKMITDVIETGPKTSHWVMRAGNETIEWDAEIAADEPGRRIAWRSIGGDSNRAGEVVFEPAPLGRGTIVIVAQEVWQGEAKTAVETIFSRNPKHAVVENLRHFKALAENGEIPCTKGEALGPREVPGRLKTTVYGKKAALPSRERKAS